MKKYLCITVLLFMVLISQAGADQWTIADNYIGGGYSPTYAQNGGDVISLPSEINAFDIDNMIVSIDSSGTVEVKITTDYIDGTSGTRYGDLFISTDGWHPFGDSPYRDDVYGNGESWEFAFDTSLNSIYSIADVSILTSNNFFSHLPSSYYRTNQEVQINSNGATPVSAGTSFTKDLLYLTYAFNLSDLGISLDQGYDLGFRWSMTCANDVIEGGVSSSPVPDPATFLMMGMGLLGLSAAARKKKDKSGSI